MADRYIKLDTVLILIETIKEWYKEDPKKHPINYGTMVGMEVGINTGEMFTKQDIVKPILDKMREEVESIEHYATNDGNGFWLRTPEEIKKDVLDIFDKYRAESESE